MRNSTTEAYLALDVSQIRRRTDACSICVWVWLLRLLKTRLDGRWSQAQSRCGPMPQFGRYRRTREVRSGHHVAHYLTTFHHTYPGKITNLTPEQYAVNLVTVRSHGPECRACAPVADCG